MSVLKDLTATHTQRWISSNSKNGLQAVKMASGSSYIADTICGNNNMRMILFIMQWLIKLTILPISKHKVLIIYSYHVHLK